MFAVFECVAQAVRNKGLRGLCEFVPGGPYLYEIASEAFRLLREKRRDAALREELARIAAASTEEAKRAAAEVARQVAGDARPDEAMALELYLTQIPGAVRASLKRTADPTGRTVPPDLAIDSPEDLARMLPHSVPQFRPGSELPGRPGWQLEELLGAGGFGEVWLARHSFIPHPRAVKFCTDPLVRSKLTSHEGRVIARVMGQGNHPNVVPLLDAVLDGDTPWLMYEYVGGGSLTDLILRWQALASGVREALAVAGLAQLAAAVGTFHRLSPPIVHRDLKPANVLVGEADPGDDAAPGRLRITDFGIGGAAVDYARSINSAEASKHTVLTGWLATSLRGSYTPLYASPQQRAGSPPDPRDDVHALGVIAYQMLTGRLTEAPGIDAAEDLHEVGASAGFIGLITKCVANRAERRPRDASELAARLAELRPDERPAVRRVEPMSAAPAAAPPAAAERTKVVVPVRGTWFRRASGESEAVWPQDGLKLPAEVTAMTGEEYRVALNPDSTSDAELAKLGAASDLPGLVAIDLTGCRKVSDAGLLQLARIRGLRSVTLADTAVTDSGVARLLNRLPGLEEVNLAGAEGVSRAMLGDLGRLRRLKSVVLPPRASSIDVKVEFARRRPGCRVV